jgi:glycolate oxidase FAD binding subunit
MVPSRPGAAEDAVDGVVPDRVVEPTDASGVSAALHEATAHGRVTVVRGRGTKLGWGRPPQHAFQVLSLAGLSREIVHRDGDLTATVSAPTRLSDLNQQLGTKGQWLPIESAHPDTTIGGLVATNDAGPRRHRYGTPRDLLIGVTLALADGRVVKAGGTVVKNVAGYDLGRFVSGSLGALAVVLDATFKLAPLPAASGTLRVPCESAAQVGAACAALSASQLEPAALDIAVATSGGRVAQRAVLVRFSTSPRATSAQRDACRRLLPESTPVDAADEAAVWEHQLAAAWRAGTTVRVSWPPADTDVAVRDVEACGGSADVVFSGRGGVGVGLIHCAADAAATVQLVERLRRSPTLRHVAVLQASSDVKRLVDVWGTGSAWAAPMGSLKRALDPAGILGAGRGPV